ncbi:MAG: SulP family inorganic anion transporter [Saprospiraceae bacterium]
MIGVPKKGYKGLIENWQSDLMAAVSVALVALPLALGIAIASGAPPITGILSAIIGGVVTTFFRGSHVAINGPAAGLIAVILTAIAALDDGTGRTLNYVFAAIVVSGAIQVLLGLLKMGKFADIFHSTVVHGILAAIGIIIFAKQIHFALGTTTQATSVVDTLVDAVRQIPNINPFVASISLAGLLLLIFHSKISFKFFHFLPAPMWVLVISIPFVYLFNFFDAHSINFLGKEYAVGPELLVNIPNNILDAIAYPDFSKIGTIPFWTSVLSITMIASIESLASAKAIDKLDPYKRKTNLNKDLIGIGVSTIVCGMLGGLPIINVIVRSTVNVHNNAKTKWSNLYHGILLIIIVFLGASLIQKVPLAALAILLVFTGFKLASPAVFKHVYNQGIEQIVFFVGTLVITLFTDLLIGIFGGLALALVTHLLLAKVPFRTFFRMIFKSGSELLPISEGKFELKIKGIANFLSTISINKLLDQIPQGAEVKIDLSGTRLVDFSIMENLYDFQRIHKNTGGTVELLGLDKHISSSNHKLALKIINTKIYKLSAREEKLKELSAQKGWNFLDEPRDNFDYYQTFYFFQSRPIKNISNRVFLQEKTINWSITDLTFEEGAFILMEKYKTTLTLIKLTSTIPRFTIEKKDFTDKYLSWSGHKDIDYETYRDFSNDYITRVENLEKAKLFLNNDIKELIENNDIISHIESNGEAILLFNDNLKRVNIEDYEKIVNLAKALKNIIRSQYNFN